MSSTALKDVRESLTHTFDFSNDLVVAAEVISTVNTTVTDLTEISTSNTDTTVTVTVNGGTANVTGVVDVEITTDQTNTYVQSLFITVLDGSTLVTSEIDIVRLWIGDTDPDGYILTDQEIATILYQFKDDPSTVRIYKTVIICLTQMKSLYAQSGFRSRDRELSTEVEEYGKERYDSICSLLDYYKKHPEDIIDPEHYTMSPLRIGGVRVDEYNSVAGNPNGLNGIANLKEARTVNTTSTIRKPYYRN